MNRDFKRDPTTMKITNPTVFAHGLAIVLTFSLPLTVHAAETNSPLPKKSPQALATATAKANVAKEVVVQGPVEVLPGVDLNTGKSTLLRLAEPALRISIGNPDVADVTLINAKEVYVLGKKTGITNLIVWSANGKTTLRDVAVGLDTGALQNRLAKWVPTPEPLMVDVMADTVVLRGRVPDATKLQRIVSLAEAYTGGKKVINMLRVEGSQQVMLEVKVAEVSRTLLDELGVDINLTRTAGSTSVSLLSQFLSSGATAVTAARANGLTTITLTAEMKKGLVKILAEPTITAMSGQEGSFLAGGKIFIPVPSGNTGNIVLEEKEFGVGLTFTPTVLEEGLINLKVTPEVSELSQLGATVRALNGQVSVLPSITTRRASTTVQLRDGESFAIGGLIKSNVTEAIRALPLLGELPVLGALFRSNSFQTEKSELLFVVTPRLSKTADMALALPTDNFKPPTRSEFLIEGLLEKPSPTDEGPAATQAETAPEVTPKP
jgi:pilus assembly protein CpaC